MFGGGALIYCTQCRARHSERAKASKKESRPSCDKTGGMKCEVIQDKPYRIHADNWLPLIIYEKALMFSPETQTQGYKDGVHQISTHKKVSLEAIKFVISAYLEDDEIDDMSYLLDALAVLKGVHEGITKAG